MIICPVCGWTTKFADEMLGHMSRHVEELKQELVKAKCTHKNVRIINWNKYCEDCDTWL